MQMRT